MRVGPALVAIGVGDDAIYGPVYNNIFPLNLLLRDHHDTSKTPGDGASGRTQVEQKASV
jgi:hypothetical protein